MTIAALWKRRALERNVEAIGVKDKLVSIWDGIDRQTRESPLKYASHSLSVASLEETLKILTFDQGCVELWRDIPKLPAYHVVIEEDMTEEGDK